MGGGGPSFFLPKGEAGAGPANEGRGVRHLPRIIQSNRDGFTAQKESMKHHYFILIICRTVRSHCSSPLTGSNRAFRIFANPPLPMAMAAFPPREII